MQTGISRRKRRRLFHTKKTLIALFLILAVLRAYPQAAPAPANLLVNGDFQRTLPKECLWNGVDSAGYLAGERGSVPVLQINGAIGIAPMPVSVAVADMNHDGLQDIATMDVQGYMHIYFNTGTRTEPKFATGDLSTIFLTRVYPEDTSALLGAAQANMGVDNWPSRMARIARVAPRMALADMSRSGKMDIVVGNYCGEILHVPNAGTAVRPDFEQPANISSLAIPTRKRPGERWGNVFAPFVYDWNGDGRPDLLIGEGSYSANNIHLFMNQGNPGTPVYNEDNHTIAAYGDGRMQLTPCVVDYYGDGKPALLVADRTGGIAVYVNKTTGKWKPGNELTFLKYITSGAGDAPVTFQGITTVAAGDFHGSGLFDIVVGESTGRISMLRNTGSKTEPKFADPVELMSTGSASTPMAQPTAWRVDYGLTRGNFYARAEVVTKDSDPTAQIPAGSSCMRFGYRPVANKVLPPANEYTAASPLYDAKNAIQVGRDPLRLPAQYFSMSQDNLRLLNETSYTLSFKVRGGQPLNAVAHVWCRAGIEGKITRGDRGSASIQYTTEDFDDRTDFSSTQNWVEVKKGFLVHFKNPALKEVKSTLAAFVIGFALAPGAGDVYISDVKLEPVAKK